MFLQLVSRKLNSTFESHSICWTLLMKHTAICATFWKKAVDVNLINIGYKQVLYSMSKTNVMFAKDAEITNMANNLVQLQ